MLLSDKNYRQQVEYIPIYNSNFFNLFSKMMNTLLHKKQYNLFGANPNIRIIMKSNKPYMYDEYLYCPSYEIYYKNILILTLHSDVYRYNTHYEYKIHHFYHTNRLYRLYDYHMMEKILENRLCSDIINNVFSFI